MKRFLLPYLICPACLPREEPLILAAVKSEAEDDIDAGRLSCRRCRRSYEIREGIAFLLADTDGGASGGQLRYEEGGTVDRYLWSHYGELADIKANEVANAAWAEMLATAGQPGLDIGCAVGRLTFEMAARCNFAVGCDLSASFIRAARRLARERAITFSLPLEGNLNETFKIDLPRSWHSDNIEFVVADALRLPFMRESFFQASSINLIDRVAYPLAHLYEINRVTAKQSARLLFASPYSWAASSAPENLWLGGTASGDYSGNGADNVRGLLEGKNGIIQPAWRAVGQGAVEWRLRSHRNHTELINSQYLLAER